MTFSLHRLSIPEAFPNFRHCKLSSVSVTVNSPSAVNRGHQYKIYVNHSRCVRKYFFAERVVGLWNILSTDTDFGTLKRFKLSIKSTDFKKFLHTEC